MERLYTAVACLFLLPIALALEAAQMPGDKAVVRLDPALDSLLSPDATLEVVKTGLGFTEGPNWVQRGKRGFLIFTDIPANVVYKMTPDGALSVFLDQSGFHGPTNGYALMSVGVEMDSARAYGTNTNDPQYKRWLQIGADGSTLDPQGRLVICTFAGRSVDRIEKNGKRTVIADRYQGKRLGGPNDVVVKNDGTIYFTDTFGGMRGRDKDPTSELDFQGVYMVKDGAVKLATKDIPFPNGLAFSPDERYLYLNGGNANYIRRYEVQPDDTVANGQLLIDLNSDKSPGTTDGMRVDSKGDIYSTGPGGVWIISPDGKHLGTILVPDKVANLTFGDPDYRTIYMTARATIYKIRVKTPGHHR